jgi:diguanylate cyclase (GGDEF)-like protein
MMGEGAEGVLRLDSARPGAYNQDDLRFLDVLLDLVATALMNAKLFAQTQRLASTDGLTGLALRRPFLEHLARELTRAGRGRDEVSLLMLDVDHFKDYNDTYGHRAGDMVLKAIADVLRQVVPPDGLAARYGGEEFAILLPETNKEGAVCLAERVLAVVNQQPFKYEDRTYNVTVSAGVATTCGEQEITPVELIRRADERLYQAKHEGRNRVAS